MRRDTMCRRAGVALAAVLVALVSAGCTIGEAPVAETPAELTRDVTTAPPTAAGPTSAAPDASPSPESLWSPWAAREEAAAEVAAFTADFAATQLYRVQLEERVSLGEDFLTVSSEDFVNEAVGRVYASQRYAVSDERMWFEVAADEGQAAFFEDHRLRAVTEYGAEPKIFMTFSGGGVWDEKWLDVSAAPRTTTTLSYFGVVRPAIGDYAAGFRAVLAAAPVSFDDGALGYDLPAAVATSFLPTRTAAVLIEYGIDTALLTSVVPALVTQAPGGLTVSLDVSPLLRDAVEQVADESIAAYLGEALMPVSVTVDLLGIATEPALPDASSIVTEPPGPPFL